MTNLLINGGEVELIELGSNLADGSLGHTRRKFAESLRKTALEQIIDELLSGSLYRGDWKKGEIEITGIERIISNRFWTEVEYRVLFPARKQGSDPTSGTYRAVRWNVGVNAGAAVLPITSNGDIVMVRQFRHAARRWMLEIPRGVRMPDESLEQCGLREAGEEAGISVSQESEVIDLGEYQPDTGVLMQNPRILAVTNCETDEALIRRDVSESTLSTVVTSHQQCLEMVKQDKLPDGFTQAALFRAGLRGLL